MMQLALIIATVGSTTAASCKGSWGALWAATGNGSLYKQDVTSQKPRGGVTCHAVSCSPIGDMGSDLVFWTCNCSSAHQCWALLPRELLLWGLHLDSQGIRGTCPAAVTCLEGCNTSLHPGNWIGKWSLLVGPLLEVWEVLGPSGGLPMGAASSAAAFSARITSPVATSSMGELVDAGWVLLGMVVSGWSVRDPSCRATPPKTASSGKKT